MLTGPDEAPADHRPAQPDANGQFGRIVEIRSYENRLPDYDFESGLFQQFPGSRLADVLSVVDVSGGNRPQSGSGSSGTAPDHQDPAGLILNQRRHADSGVAEVDVITSGAH